MRISILGIVLFLLGFSVVWSAEPLPQWVRTFDVGTLGQINALQSHIEALELRVQKLEAGR